MCLPDRHRSLEDEIPDNYPAVGITGDETEILVEYLQRVDGGGMATENVNGGCWGARLGGAHWKSLVYTVVSIYTVNLSKKVSLLVGKVHVSRKKMKIQRMELDKDGNV